MASWRGRNDNKLDIVIQDLYKPMNHDNSNPDDSGIDEESNPGGAGSALTSPRGPEIMNNPPGSGGEPPAPVTPPASAPKHISESWNVYIHDSPFIRDDPKWLQNALKAESRNKAKAQRLANRAKSPGLGLNSTDSVFPSKSTGRSHTPNKHFVYDESSPHKGVDDNDDNGNFSVREMSDMLMSKLKQDIADDKTDSTRSKWGTQKTKQVPYKANTEQGSVSYYETMADPHRSGLSMTIDPDSGINRPRSKWDTSGEKVTYLFSDNPKHKDAYYCPKQTSADQGEFTPDSDKSTHSSTTDQHNNNAPHNWSFSKNPTWKSKADMTLEAQLRNVTPTGFASNNNDIQDMSGTEGDTEDSETQEGPSYGDLKTWWEDFQHGKPKGKKPELEARSGRQSVPVDRGRPSATPSRDSRTPNAKRMTLSEQHRRSKSQERSRNSKLSVAGSDSANPASPSRPKTLDTNSPRRDSRRVDVVESATLPRNSRVRDAPTKTPLRSKTPTSEVRSPTSTADRFRSKTPTSDYRYPSSTTDSRLRSKTPTREYTYQGPSATAARATARSKTPTKELAPTRAKTPTRELAGTGAKTPTKEFARAKTPTADVTRAKTPVRDYTGTRSKTPTSELSRPKTPSTDSKTVNIITKTNTAAKDSSDYAASKSVFEKPQARRVPKSVNRARRKTVEVLSFDKTVSDPPASTSSFQFPSQYRTVGAGASSTDKKAPAKKINVIKGANVKPQARRRLDIDDKNTTSNDVPSLNLDDLDNNSHQSASDATNARSQLHQSGVSSGDRRQSKDGEDSNSPRSTASSENSPRLFSKKPLKSTDKTKPPTGLSRKIISSFPKFSPAPVFNSDIKFQSKMNFGQWEDSRELPKDDLPKDDLPKENDIDYEYDFSSNRKVFSNSPPKTPQRSSFNEIETPDFDEDDEVSSMLSKGAYKSEPDLLNFDSPGSGMSNSRSFTNTTRSTSRPVSRTSAMSPRPTTPKLGLLSAKRKHHQSFESLGSALMDSLHKTPEDGADSKQAPPSLSRGRTPTKREPTREQARILPERRAKSPNPAYGGRARSPNPAYARAKSPSSMRPKSPVVKEGSLVSSRFAKLSLSSDNLLETLQRETEEEFQELDELGDTFEEEQPKVGFIFYM